MSYTLQMRGIYKGTFKKIYKTYLYIIYMDVELETINEFYDSADISSFLSKPQLNYSKYSYIHENDIHRNLPRLCHSSRKKMSLDLLMLNSFILIIDFANIGGGTSHFIECIISRYKLQQTFLIIRNIKKQIYLTINDEYELDNIYNENSLYLFLLENRDNIEKIFVNHVIGHSPNFIQNIFNLNKTVTTITHDFKYIFDKFNYKFNEMYEQMIRKNFKKDSININNFHQIITQNVANLYIYNNYIQDKDKIVITPLPDYKNPKDFINTNNDKIVIGIIGDMIYDIKGLCVFEKIYNFYKDNNNVEFVVFGNCNNLTNLIKQPYKNIDELNSFLEKYKPNILIELSIWHETYSYTLSLAMITQLPIIYLKKNEKSVIENRLSAYNKAYSFTTLKEFDFLINEHKQNFLYTIEPIIYFNDFWDNYFIKKLS
jgi:hypothetical protein